MGIVLRLVAMVLIASLMTLVKMAGDRGIALPEVMFWRQAVTVPLLLAWLMATGGIARLRTRRMSSHAIRATTGMTAMLCSFGAVTLLPLAEATTLGFTTPLFAVVLTALFVREHVGPWRWAAVILGFVGVLVITQPGNAEVISPLGTAAGLAAGFLVAVVSFQIRDLAQSDDALACVFWFAVFGALFTALVLPVYATAHDLEGWLILMGVGTVGTFAQFVMTLALRYGTVATVIVMDYSLLIWTTLSGWLVWDQLPTPWTIVGAPVIIVAGGIIAWRQNLLRKAAIVANAQELD
nr:DMT family transporter [Novosphingobium marinum]